MKNFGYIMTTKMLIEGKRKVRFMYREEPINEQDSGWQFLCGDEKQNYIENPDNIKICDIQTIMGLDKSIIPYLSAIVGSAYERKDEEGIFQKSDNVALKIPNKREQRLAGLINKIKKITATDEYAMEFYKGASDEAITDFERKNKFQFPKSVKAWLKYTNGCCLFDSTVQLYGVTHPPLIDVNPKGIGEGYIEIGAFNYGDSICITGGQSKIFLCAETTIEYSDFEDFLEYVIEIGEGGQ